MVGKCGKKIQLAGTQSQKVTLADTDSMDPPHTYIDKTSVVTRGRLTVRKLDPGHFSRITVWHKHL